MDNDGTIPDPFSRRTILLVDDNEDDIFIMRTVFRKVGISNPVQVLTNGEEAIHYLSGEGAFADRERFPLPAIILLDLNMPRVNGFEVLNWIRKQPGLKRLIVEVLTASSRPGDVERAFDAGANSYLVKPSRMEELIETMTAWHQLMNFRSFPVLPPSES
ncbi:MAG TPA: response regulator [Verrucomicrobiae bacterium]|nr:response regulator [Verrucomicrobiae bacterium]